MIFLFSARLDNDEVREGIYTNIKPAYGDQYELSKLGEQGISFWVKKKWYQSLHLPDLERQNLRQLVRKLFTS